MATACADVTTEGCSGVKIMQIFLQYEVLYLSEKEDAWLPFTCFNSSSWKKKGDSGSREDKM